jgi:isopenicillin N synthase-like dioxygenase
MSAVAMGLGIDEHFFADKIDAQYHNLRLLHYPPITAAILKGYGQARAGSHSGIVLAITH